MKKKSKLLPLILCIALLSGSIRPLSGYAALEADMPDYGESNITNDATEDLTEAFTESPGEDPSGEPGSGSADDAVESKYQNQIDSINDKISSLQQEEQKIKENIADAKSEREKAEAEKSAIDHQVNLTQGQIALLYERIGLLEQDIVDKLQSIDEKQGDIEEKQQEIDDNLTLLKKRLRAMYMQNTSTTLSLVLGSDSFSDFLTRTEYIRRIGDHDRRLMETLTRQRSQMEKEKGLLEDEKAAMEQVKQSVDADRKVTEQKKQQLGVQQQKAQLQLQDVKSMEEAYMADLKRNKQIQDAAQAELDRIFKEIEWSKNAYSGGAMAWPVPGFSLVTSEFGPRFGGTNMHTGIDISGSGVFGNRIVAANDGVVAKVNFQYAQGVGYGIYLVIDHGVDENGNSISTLYGHCSGISVSQGQSVKRGEAVAQVGNTGWSTGPHLHFEVRINGTAVNPRPYIF